MHIIDISIPITPDMTVYKDQPDKKPVFKTTRSIEAGDRARETDICLNTHTGTHIDAKSHFLKDGEGISHFPLHHFIGKCRVIDLTSVKEKISENDIRDKEINEGDIILFKTANSLRTKPGFNFDFIYVDKTAAGFLAGKKIKTVGIDSLGIERAQPENETHKTLLSNNIAIIEGLNLAETEEGEYFLCCPPLSLGNLDASPARAVLIKDM
ncbi:MAG: cyclase family protein [Firmicutes bacterium]|nr:cyclase family protein [Bacillota bacterium]